MASRWWRWTPSYSGTVRLKAVRNMEGLPLDVFTGTNLTTLKRIAQNDRRTYLSGISGIIRLPVRAGKTYFIRVDDTVTASPPSLPGFPVAYPPQNIVLTIEPLSVPLPGEVLLSTFSVRRGLNGVPYLAPMGRVFMPDGKTPVTDPNFRAQLYAGPGPRLLMPMGQPQSFIPARPSDWWAGCMVPTPVTITNVSAYRFVYVQVKVWDSSLGDSYESARLNHGVTGQSRIMDMFAGSEEVGPAELKGFTSFSLWRH